jgi:hypothetical protein
LIHVQSHPHAAVDEAGERAERARGDSNRGGEIQDRFRYQNRIS